MFGIISMMIVISIIVIGLICLAASMFLYFGEQITDKFISRYTKQIKYEIEHN